jgi:hypothetical protein
VTRVGCPPVVCGPLLSPGKWGPAEEECRCSEGWSWMVRLSQGCTPARERLALLGCGGSRGQFFYFNCSKDRQDNMKGPLQWGFNGWTFHSFYPDNIFLFCFRFVLFFNWVKLPWSNVLPVYMSKKMYCLKKWKKHFYALKHMSRASKNSHFVSI